MDDDDFLHGRKSLGRRTRKRINKSGDVGAQPVPDAPPSKGTDNVKTAAPVRGGTRNTRKYRPRRKYPVIWSTPQPLGNGANRITRCTIRETGQTPFVIYDILAAGIGPDVYGLDTLKTLVRDTGNVFVWTGRPSPDQRREALDVARIDGVAVVVHTTPRYGRPWRRAALAIQ
jgi:hypothetical protein